MRQNGDDEDGEKWGSPVLLIDDLSVLLSLGVSAGAILDFTLYCQAIICSELQVSLNVYELLFLDQCLCEKTVQVLNLAHASSLYIYLHLYCNIS